MAIRIILADDHAVLRSGLKNLLERSMDLQVVAEVGNGLEVIDLVNHLQPDVLVLDVELPGKNGIAITEELKASHSNVRILVFSGYDDPFYIQGVLDSGAAGYLTKDEPGEVLIQAIRGVASGQQGWLSRKVSATVMSLYQKQEHSENNITRREGDVYTRVAEGKTNKQIAFELSISEKTVEKYVYSLFQKFDVVSRVELAVLKTRNEQNELQR